MGYSPPSILLLLVTAGVETMLAHSCVVGVGEETDDSDEGDRITKRLLGIGTTAGAPRPKEVWGAKP